MTIFGVDYSHYDNPSTAGAVGEGFAFFTHKAGGDSNDAEIAAWWDVMKGYRDRVLLGAYWVLYPGSASARADAFLARLDATCDGWRNGPFILQVDCEEWSGDAGTVPSKSDIKIFCDRLKAKMPKLRPIVYGPEWVYGDKLAGLGYPLWASRYVTGSGAASSLYPGDNSSRWDAYSGQTPAVLQFTSSATIAGQTTCDANAYRGTLGQLTALVAPGWSVAPEVPDMELTDKIGDEHYPNRTVGDVFRDIAQLRGFLVGDLGDTGAANYKTSAPVVQLAALPALVGALPSVTQIVTAVVAALPPAATGGLSPQQITDAATDGVRQAFEEAFPTV